MCCRLLHHIDGRFRLKDAGWKDCPEILDEMSRELVTIPGVSAVLSNVVTGSIVVEYDATVLAASCLARAMQERGFPALPPSAPGLAAAGRGSPTKTLLDIAARALVEAALGRLGTIVVAAVL